MYYVYKAYVHGYRYTLWCLLTYVNMLKCISPFHFSFSSRRFFFTVYLTEIQKYILKDMKEKFLQILDLSYLDNLQNCGSYLCLYTPQFLSSSRKKDCCPPPPCLSSSILLFFLFSHFMFLQTSSQPDNFPNVCSNVIFRITSQRKKKVWIVKSFLSFLG